MDYYNLKNKFVSFKIPHKQSDVLAFIVFLIHIHTWIDHSTGTC